jgi:hypothetical protein
MVRLRELIRKKKKELKNQGKEEIIGKLSTIIRKLDASGIAVLTEDDICLLKEYELL